MSWLSTFLGGPAAPAPATGGPLLECADAVVRRDGFRITVPAWSVRPGTVVGLLGPNGAGKSTLLEGLVGLGAIAPGGARVVGLDPASDGARVRAAVALMSDDMPVFPGRLDRVLRRVGRFYPTWSDERAGALMERFRLRPDAPSQNLSKGEGTRFRLVLALAWAPRLVLLDEPGTGLDLSQRRALLETILDVVSESDRAVVVSSHQIADVERIADELLVVADGGVVRGGPIDALVDNGQTLEEALLTWGAA